MPASRPVRKSRLRTALEGLVWALTPDCREVLRLTSFERDGKLPWLVRVRLRLHRVFCKYCQRYGRQLDFLGIALRRMPTERRALPPEARQRIRNMLREE